MTSSISAFSGSACADAETITYRERCYVCFRPQNACFCDAIPSVANRTHVLILQHVKERFHAFNTARIVRHALNNCELLVDQTANLATAALPLQKSTGVLYPGDDALLLSELPADRKPAQLVILDGTWHHAKTLMRDIPALQHLPRYRLAPEHPSNYRIRREPTESALSTIEATVQALQALEPETTGLPQLLAAFQRMVDEQVRRSGQTGRIRQRTGPPRPALNIPSVLIDDIANVVVAYGETSHGETRQRRRDQSPIYWVARRLGTAESFTSAIQPAAAVSETFLQQLQLTADDFQHALSETQFRTAWQKFVRPTDTLCVYNENTARLLDGLNAGFTPHISLKSVNVLRHCQTLDDVLASLQLVPPQLPQKGRAGQRLANAIAFARYLHELSASKMSEHTDYAYRTITQRSSESR